MTEEVDSRLKISGMTAGEVIPECFYEESKQWKETSLWFTIEGQKEKADKPNFEKELINITRILELHHRLKIKELNVAEFIGYQKQAQEVIESQNKSKK